MLEIMAWIADNDETRTQHEHAIYHSKSNNNIQYDEDEKMVIQAWPGLIFF